MKKSSDEREVEDIIRAQAANAVMWQKAAQAGAEMEKWVADGHYSFIQTRILAPIELECFKKTKTIRLGSHSAIANIAKVQGTLEVFDKISARIESAIHAGKDALDNLTDLEMQNSTRTKEGE
jgi:hypothetical protein